MLTGFIIFGFGWSLVWQAQRKYAAYSVSNMPLWFYSNRGKNTLSWLTILFGIVHLILAIYIFSWIGILFWVICAIITQLISAFIFHKSRIKNPTPPFITGIISIIIGLIIILLNKN